MRPEHRLTRTLIVALLVALPGHDTHGQENGVPSRTNPPLIAKDYLDAVSLDTIGLIGPETSGLPTDLWHHSTTVDLVALIKRQTTALPASLLEIFHVLMLVETRAPGTGAADGTLLQARIGSLIALGAIDQARALLSIVGPGQPAFFPHWRDVGLLSGMETRICNRLLIHPSLSPALADHIYCNHALGRTEQARNLFEIALALGGLPPKTESILRLLFVQTAARTPMPRVANGDVLLTRILFDTTDNTAPLPGTVKFAPLRLSEDLPALIRVQAIEALARSQAASFEQVLAVYRRTHWALDGPDANRIKGLLAFDRALLLGQTAEGLAMLDTLSPHLATTGLLHAFAEYYAESLGTAPAVTSLAQQIILALGGIYRECLCGPLVGGERDLAALIRHSFGMWEQETGLAGANMPALRAGLDGTIASPVLTDLIASGRHGEALLMAMAPFNDRDAITPMHLQDAIALLVHYNASEQARDLAVEWMAMEVLN